MCLADRDRTGSELSMLLPPSPGGQSAADPEEATELARSMNNYKHQLTRQYPSWFAAFAAVGLQNP